MSGHDFLQEIVEYKKECNRLKAEYYTAIRNKIDLSEYCRYGVFAKSVGREGQVNLIAEIKKASPSKGVIREPFDVLEIAKTYTEHKAAAISVLTEDKYFLGRPDYVKKVSEQFTVPVLMKDFFIHENQIYEALVKGASAILLICAILSDEQLKQLLSVANALDLDCLVETHDETEVKRAIDVGAEIIGVNNRDLHTFEVSMQTSLDLIPKIPRDRIAVAESGIRTNADIRQLKEVGAKAVLIGETFMRAEDIGAKVDEIMSGG